MKSRTFNIKTANSKGNKEQTLLFEGDLGIKNAEAIKNAIQALKFNSESVKINLRNVEKLDITTIQNIRALRNALSGMGKTVSTSSELPREIERLLTNTGFDNSL